MGKLDLKVATVLGHLPQPASLLHDGISKQVQLQPATELQFLGIHELGRDSIRGKSKHREGGRKIRGLGITYPGRGAMEVCGSKWECKHELVYFIMKAYLLSLLFLVVVLYWAVGDAWTQYAELVLHSVTARSSRYSHYSYLDFGFSP